MTDRLNDWFTGIIALATLAYVGVTCLLWRVTKRSADAAKDAADAAKISAEAAKQSADMDAALHRPYLGVSEFRRHNDYNQDSWAIRCCIRNYGTLPATDVRVDFAIGQSPGGSSYGGGVLFSHAEVLPQAEAGEFFRIGVGNDVRKMISNGLAMVAQVTISYLAGGVLRTHTARFRYTPTTMNFKVDSSETKEGRG